MRQHVCTLYTSTLSSSPPPTTHTHTHTVYGALLGTQKGRSVEVCNSFELVVSNVEGRVVLDKEYFSAKEEQCMSGPARAQALFLFSCCTRLHGYGGCGEVLKLISFGQKEHS